MNSDIPRYYAQHITTDEIFYSGHKTAWQIFDRELYRSNGTPLPIALCANKIVAFKIRDALNSNSNSNSNSAKE